MQADRQLRGLCLTPSCPSNICGFWLNLLIVLLSSWSDLATRYSFIGDGIGVETELNRMSLVTSGYIRRSVLFSLLGLAH